MSKDLTGFKEHFHKVWLTSKSIEDQTLPIQTLHSCIHSSLQLCLNQSHPELRKLTLITIKRFTEQGIPLQTISWPAFIILYTQHNKGLVQRVLTFAANHDDNKGWELELNSLVNDLIESIPKIETSQTLERVLFTLCLISQSSPPLIKSIAQRSDQVLKKLINLYNSKARDNSIQTNLSDFSRYNLISIVFNLLESDILIRLRLISPASEPLYLIERLYEILCCPNSKGFIEDIENHQFLHDLLDHLPSLYHLILSFSNKLQLPSEGVEKLTKIISLLESLHPQSSKPKSNSISTVKMESKYLNIIDQILSILPEIDRKMVIWNVESKKEYQDEIEGPARFIDDHLSGRTEELDIQEDDQLLEILNSRKNIFDDHQFDTSLLRKGKNKLNEHSIMDDKSHLTDEIRAKIKARAEALSSDEEEEDLKEAPLIILGDSDGDETQPQGREDQTTIDIFSDDDEAFIPTKLGSRALREGVEDESDEEDESPIGIQNETHLPTTNKNGNILSNRANQPILYKFYIENPEVFNRSSRGSQERNRLKDKLEGGMVADDLLESWRIMFERNPEKEKILSRYAFRSESQSYQNDELTETDSGPSHQHQHQHQGFKTSDRGSSGRGGRGGRGNGGRGRGGSGAGGGGGGDGGRGTGRGRGRNSSNKLAHDRRVRGRDKKLKQMSGPG
ncbi:hypothetical protein DFH28DRAFT_1172419 [Melampsora americana]|nr:hypothetical protein DFH28DRAFT_1172419 [Melampsora americana]